MTKTEIKKSERRLKELQAQLGNLGPVMRGTIVRIGTRNKQFYWGIHLTGVATTPCGWMVSAPGRF